MSGALGISFNGISTSSTSLTPTLVDEGTLFSTNTRSVILVPSILLFATTWIKETRGLQQGLLWELGAELECLVILFQKGGRLFTENDVKTVYRKYFRGDCMIVDAPAVRHSLKLLRTKATKQQLETAMLWLSQIRRVQGEIWKCFSLSWQAFCDARAQYASSTGLDIKFGKSLSLQLLGDSITVSSGKLEEMTLWNIGWYSRGQILSIIGFLLVYRKFMSTEQLFSLICETQAVPERLVNFLCVPLPRRRVSENAFQMNAAKIGSLWKMVNMVQQQQKQLQNSLQQHEDTLTPATGERFTGLVSKVLGDEEWRDFLRSYTRAMATSDQWKQLPESWTSLSAPWPGDAGYVDHGPLPTHIREMTSIPHDVFARHLTLLDAALVLSVTSQELLEYARLSKSTPSSNAFHRVEARFNRIVWIIVTMLCRLESVSAQTAAIEYWIRVELVLERSGNLHGAMCVNLGLSHYLVEQRKKAWAALPSEVVPHHQRIVNIFQPMGNYREYRGRLRSLMGKLVDHLFFDSESDSTLVIPAAPVAQRDFTMGSEMTTLLDGGGEDSPIVNWQKMRVLGEPLAVYHICHRTCSSLLQRAAIDESVANFIRGMPWTTDEDALVQEMHAKRDAKAVLAVSPRPADVAKRTMTPRVFPSASNNDGVVDRTSFSTLDSVVSAGGGVTAAAVVVINPLLALLEEKPARREKIASMLTRRKPPVKRQSVPALLMAPATTALSNSNLAGASNSTQPSPHSSAPNSARLTGGGDSPKRVALVSARRLSVLMGSDTNAAAAAAAAPKESPPRGAPSSAAIEWCAQCSSRRSVAGSHLCIDCEPNAVSTGITEFSLHIHVGDAVRTVRVRKGITWNAACYVISCELGDAFLEKGLVERDDKGVDSIPISNDSDWLRVCRHADDKCVLHLWQSKLPSFLISPRPGASTQSPGSAQKTYKVGRSKKGLFSGGSGDGGASNDANSPLPPLQTLTMGRVAIPKSDQRRTAMSEIFSASAELPVAEGGGGGGGGGGGEAARRPEPMLVRSMSEMSGLLDDFRLRRSSASGGAAVSSSDIHEPALLCAKCGIALVSAGNLQGLCRACVLEFQKHNDNLCISIVPQVGRPAKTTIVRSSLSWSEVQYVLSCSIGEEVVEGGLVATDNSGKRFLINQEKIWQAALINAGDGVLQLERRDLFAASAVVIPPPPPPISDGSKIRSPRTGGQGTLSWCISCKSRRAATGKDFCDDCASSWCAKCEQRPVEREGGLLCAECAAPKVAPILRICVHLSSEKSVDFELKRTMSWKEALFEMEEQVGTDAVEKGFFYRNDASGAVFSLETPADWTVVCSLRSPVIHLYISASIALN